MAATGAGACPGPVRPPSCHTDLNPVILRQDAPQRHSALRLHLHSLSLVPASRLVPPPPIDKRVHLISTTKTLTAASSTAIPPWWRYQRASRIRLNHSHQHSRLPRTPLAHHVNTKGQPAGWLDRARTLRRRGRAGHCDCTGQGTRAGAIVRWTNREYFGRYGGGRASRRSVQLMLDAERILMFRIIDSCSTDRPGRS